MARDEVTVYQFTYFDRKAGERRVAEDYATLPAIEQMGCEAIVESARAVSPSRLSISGLLLRDRPKTDASDE